MADYPDDGAALLAGVVWGDEKPTDGRCPECALPIIWVELGDERRHFCKHGAARHARIDAMKRAASACRVAGYESYADAIVADLDRLTTPTTARNAA